MGYAISGGPYVFTSFSGDTKNRLLDGLKTALEAANWKLADLTTASCVGTFGAAPNNGTTVLLDGRQYTFRAAVNNATAGDVLLGDLAGSIQNLVNAINRGPGAGITYSNATPDHATLSASAGANTLQVTAKAAGPAGNNLACQGWGSWQAPGAGTNSRTWFGGYRLRGRSPQRDGALSVLVWIYDSGDSVGAMLRFLSDVDSSIVGYRHRLKCASGFAYQIVANPCQLFVSRPGVHADPLGSAVSGGIPFLTEDPCTEMRDGAVPPTEAWWSMGDCYFDPTFHGANPRTNLLLAEYYGHIATTWQNDACYDGHYVTPDNGEKGTPRILCLTGPGDIDSLDFLNRTQSHVKYWDESSVDQEPLIAWGDSISDTARIRGQIWDAVIRSVPTPMDDAQVFDGYRWINYTDNWFYGSLYLIAGPAAPYGTLESNYAY